MKMFVVLFLSALSCVAQPALQRAIMAQSPPAAAGFTPDFRETFDAAGFDNTEWSTSGTQDPDYTTTPAPLEGTQSLHINNGYCYRTVANNQTNLFFICNLHTWNNYSYLVVLRDSSGNILGGVLLSTSNHPYIHAGTTTLTLTGVTMNLDTTYYIWVTYIPGTGADAKAAFWISETTTKPESPNGTIANGNGTAYPGQLYVRNSGDAIFDRVITHSQAIPSNP